MIDELVFYGGTDWHERFPPRNARKGYVARIDGRASGAEKYDRTFLGSGSVSVLTGELETGKGIIRFHVLGLRTRAQAEKFAVAAVDAAVEQCLAVMSDMDTATKNKVLTALRKAVKSQGGS